MPNARECLRIRDLLTDGEYLVQRKELQQQAVRMDQNLKSLDNVENWSEPARELISFNNRAVSGFAEGDPQTKRLILAIVGSNLSLKDRQLNIDAKKPFQRWRDREVFSACGTS
jgi:hypothetical protein